MVFNSILNDDLAEKTAIIDSDGTVLRYGDLKLFSESFSELISKRTLIFILSQNKAASVAAYVSCLNKDIVPLIISASIDKDLLWHLIELYKPSFIWHPRDCEISDTFFEIFDSMGFVLSKTNLIAPTLHSDLSLLLSTSGTTGSPKLVRHSYDNVRSSAYNVSLLFELTGEERAIAFLPVHYTMGLSVITSHLYSGATVLLTDLALTNPGFWSFIKENEASSFTGVPYTFEILDKLRFYRMNVPSLNVLTQGGGKLGAALFEKFAKFSAENNIKFIATYGQTEGTARMAYLPSNYATKKIGSIGRAVPNGKLYLVDESNNILSEPEAIGQMVYEGANVTLGYAESGEDLRLGDMNKGVLFTGDVARRDSDGFYFITGRLKRFLKLYGLRVSLDDIEYLVKSNFQIDCLCNGDDEFLEVYVTEDPDIDSIRDFISEKTGLFHKAFGIKCVQSLPKNESGKPIY